MHFEALRSVPEYHRMAACHGCIAFQVYREGAKQVATPIGHQRLVDWTVNQRCNFGVARRCRKADHLVNSIVGPKLRQRGGISAVGHWTISRDQIADRFTILQCTQSSIDDFELVHGPVVFP